MTKGTRGGVSRRTLLGGIGVGAGAAGLAGATVAQAALLPEPRARESYDVVVIGSGMAGCAAALEAASRGAKVAVLEKSSKGKAGGNSLLAGGIFAMPTADTDTARHAFIEDFIAKALGRGNHEIYGLMAENARAGVAWLNANGIEFTPEGEMPPYRISTATAAPGPYMGMMRAFERLRERIAEEGGAFHFDTKAKQLIMNELGAVSGVRAVRPGGMVDFAARSVVIVAGGYGANSEMLESYSDPNAGALMVRGIGWATGDGLLMAREAGAGLCGMGGVMALHIAAVDPVETAAGNPFSALPYTLSINRNGTRFVDESEGYVAHGKALLTQPEQKAALIFDEAIRSLPGPAAACATFERLGIHIVEAASIEELAAAIDVPEAALKETIGKFNAAVANETAVTADPPKKKLAHALNGPRFFAFYPLVPGITLTFGGIMINKRAQALEADGRIIPGLFAAGEGAGGVFFDDYIGGGSLTNCLVMGRIAGAEAAA